MSDPSYATPEIDSKIRRLQGPILVLGASGFVGANLLREMLRVRQDVYGTTSRTPAWRLAGLPSASVQTVDLLVDTSLDALLDSLKPRTVFDCVAYGAYSFQLESQLIYRTNFSFVSRLLEKLEQRKIACYVHAGSSSEYGDNASAPREEDWPRPNSDYAVSKIASSALIQFYGKKKRFPCANLRLYSVYGPLEDSSRLIPNLIRHGVAGSYPAFVDPNISRDFVFSADASEAFIDTALNLREPDYGDSFNIGSGQKTTIREVAQTARELFGIATEPVFTMPNRDWDVPDWYANPLKARERLQWSARTSFRDGLSHMIRWYRSLPDKEAYHVSSKKFGLDTRYSVSAVVACYRDGQAIPLMYDRLKAVFSKLNIDYEIVFVNDCSPDDSEEVIRAITRNDRRVIGISHSRNFGSQAAFRSGMQIAGKNATVLLEGNLRDPPELIEQFVEQWRLGYDVVYGRRVKREAPLHQRIGAKLFYRVFDKFSYFKVPHDAGDFSLLDARVVDSILRFPERDFFLLGVRAFVGFRQTGVDYERRERRFGTNSRNFIRRVDWAKKGILSFSHVPLSMLSFFGTILVAITILLALIQTVLRVFLPSATPRGLSTIILAILFFGAVNLFALGLIGEYIAKIFEEVKRRPHFIRRSVIRDGEIRSAVTDPALVGKNDS